MTDFTSLQLLPSILKALDEQGYTSPTPIQAQAIPYLLDGRDLLGIAQTGTGKTAAFSLPILQRLANNPVTVKPKRMRTLILTPTRELASQIELNVNAYGQGLNFFNRVIFGGVNQKPQVKAMSRGVDILIATPGRLLDLIGQGYVLFDQLEVFVLDEADRMLDMGFIRDIKKIIALLPKDKQTLLFSATMPNDIVALANSLLKNPAKVEVTPHVTTVEKIDQKLNYVQKSNKVSLLKDILKDEAANCVLVFTRTKHGANRVVEKLTQAGISSAAIHGNKSQSAREKALGSFRAGEIRTLVATDIAARGIDIPQVSHVVNYDLPEDAESYVHRIGRTARAGREGIAISFCDHEEKRLLKDIERFIRMPIPVDETHAFHGVAGQPGESRDNDRSRNNPRNRSSQNTRNAPRQNRGRRTTSSNAYSSR